MDVRVRYAPSPTGLQHIGAVRTALFNYFFARSQKGSFILRIEDTDQERFHPEALQDIYDTFDWFEIHWDEGPDRGGDHGPYIQSERKELYQKYTEQLLNEGKAYRCFCTAERLEQLRIDQKKAGNKEQGYDRHCRTIDPEEAKKRAKARESYVVRFAVPLDGKTEFEDVILGTVKRKNKDINPDPIIMKSDGLPTYHLAHVVDDHLMKTSHVLRAQEWVPSAAFHTLLFEAFNWKPPLYVHLPLVLGKDGQKLSKRHGATSLGDFRRAGYLPEAIINYVCLLGWSLDDSTEFFSKEELEKVFDVARINKSPATFDYKKLDWFNGHYIRQLSDSKLLELVLPFLKEQGVIAEEPTAEQQNLLKKAIPLAKERLRTLADISAVLSFLFKDFETPGLEELIPKKSSTEQTMQVLELMLESLDRFLDGSSENADDFFHSLMENLDLGMGQVMMPIRIALTGSKASPPLYDSMQLMKKDIIITRLKKAIEKIKRG